MKYCLQTCCYLDSSFSKHMFIGFHGPPRSEGFVPPSLTEPVKSDTNNTSDTNTSKTSDTSNTPASAVSSPDQIFSNSPSPTQVSSSSSTHVPPSPTINVLSVPSPFNITPLSQQEAADFFMDVTEFIRKAISDHKTSPPNTDKRCKIGKESLIPTSRFCRSLNMNIKKGGNKRGRKGRNML